MMLIDKSGFAFTCKELAIHICMNNNKNPLLSCNVSEGSSLVEL